MWQRQRSQELSVPSLHLYISTLQARMSAVLSQPQLSSAAGVQADLSACCVWLLGHRSLQSSSWF